jgi:hypothetical protein
MGCGNILAVVDTVHAQVEDGKGEKSDAPAVSPDVTRRTYKKEKTPVCSFAVQLITYSISSVDMPLKHVTHHACRPLASKMARTIGFSVVCARPYCILESSVRLTYIHVQLPSSLEGNHD